MEASVEPANFNMVLLEKNKMRLTAAIGPVGVDVVIYGQRGGWFYRTLHRGSSLTVAAFLPRTRRSQGSGPYRSVQYIPTVLYLPT